METLNISNDGKGNIILVFTQEDGQLYRFLVTKDAAEKIATALLWHRSPEHDGKTTEISI